MSDNQKSKLEGIIGRIEKLPTPPFVFQQIAKVVNSPFASAFDIAAILSEDAAMTARVLKLTNSAYYGLSRKVADVKQAVFIIGIEPLKNLVLSSSVINTFSKGGLTDAAYVECFWRHSLAVAYMARIVARSINKSDLAFCEAAFSAGILHDIGKMVLSVYLADLHFQKIKYVREYSIPEYDAELILTGCHHGEIGQHLSKVWNLPTSLCDAVAYHHTPESPTGLDDMPFIIHLSDQLIHSNRKLIAEEFLFNVTPIAEHIWDIMKLKPDLEREFLEKFDDEYSHAETFLNIGRGD